jgi:hypothetical protein
MPSFCRHGRFVERCPICSKSLPGNEPGGGSSPRAKSSRKASASTGTVSHGRRVRGAGVKRASRGARRGRRLQLAADPRRARVGGRTAPGRGDRVLERAPGRTGARPPGSLRRARAISPHRHRARELDLLDDRLPLAPTGGSRPVRIDPRSADEPRPDPWRPRDIGAPAGPEAYRWACAAPTSPERGRRHARSPTRSGSAGPAAGSQAAAFEGDAPGPRSGALSGCTNGSRCRASADGTLRTARHARPSRAVRAAGRLAAADGGAGDDLTTLAAKRVFGIGDPLLLERRAAGLWPRRPRCRLETLDVALANWAAPQRATLGFPQDSGDSDAYARAGDALGL